MLIKGPFWGLLFEVLNGQSLSDVPLGVFLSGGLDSAAIVAIASEVSSNPIKTFSMGFEDDYYNELPNARLTARKFGTEHHEFIARPISIEEMQEVLCAFDEPFADSSAIPTYYLSRYARENATVVLSGDGGDEVTVIADNQQIVTQFRHCFHVQHPARYTRLLLRLLADDGAVVYLNGRQVARKNLPAGPLTPFTWAISGLGAADENLLTDFAIPPALLFKGRNVIAVAVHQAQSTGNDLSFDLELSAEAGFATAPRLNIARSDDGIRLCWPADVAGFHLQYSETLLDPLTWQAVPDAAEWFGGDVGVQLQHDAVPVFYRLVLE